MTEDFDPATSGGSGERLVTFTDGSQMDLEAMYPDRPDMRLGLIRSGMVMPMSRAEFEEAIARRDAPWAGPVVPIYCDGKPGEPGHPRRPIDEARLDRDGVFVACGSTVTKRNSDGGVFSVTRLPACPECGFKPEATAATMKLITETARATGSGVSFKMIEIVAFRLQSAGDTPTGRPRG